MVAAGKLYSWAELAKHNTEEDCWVAIDGKVYDITKWLPIHPGGKNILLLSAGRDVTNLFESYHLVSDKPQALLEKYQVGVVSTLEHPKYVVKSKFYATLKERVRAHFKNTAQDPQSSVATLTRVALVILFQIAMYYVSVFTTTNFLVCCVLALLHGFAETMLAMHLMHDACHAALSHNPTVWKWLGYLFDMMSGASFYAWNHQHVVGHHLYTNVRGSDPDVGEAEFDFRIVTPYTPRLWFHKYQHIYAPILYGLYAFKTRVWDFDAFVRKFNGPIRVNDPQSGDLSFYLLGKLFFVVFRVVLPLAYHDFTKAAIYFVLSELVFGYWLTFTFQVSHIAGNLTFYGTPGKPEEPSEFDEDWAVSQMKTTQDYAHGCVLTNFLTGGLNHQVVHHLFPSIAQDYYPQLVPIVKDVCKQFNITYHIRDNFKDAFQSHIDHLYHMGNDPAFVQLPLSNKNTKKSN
ncbi:hypothetical protein SAMD00019534_104910 [Acytostelium subglobosum LB1]|uniref:hypothetical protein n=1 Tax=Acytostelium subglobosum LB1 TaxID=1410327 RepID=UPI00064511A0|nr:hypothetical protein SAMD00019534_104910 [Acytostelium subglobosum LB1]GAM27316.1 hypothetical protein SAMD00019534_104910 [Acytostelium subglobosum LB1]|eukprot:XP_012749783.1 hypothetical protein SAMD00019534_104910 [Acytostelium subglobosum LB1]